jgi:predicted dienelactone hydrolase
MDSAVRRTCRHGALTAALVAMAFASLAAAHSGEGDDSPGYSVGHATAVITDPSRGPDGSPSTGAGRPLYLHVWYPAGVAARGHVAYTWNNPVYNQNPGGAVYPGLPDLPALTFPGSPSLHAVAEGVPIARGSFPLLMASHGNLVAAAKNMPDTLEALASHGYVVVSVEHTGNNDAFYQASFVEGTLHLPLGPNPSLGADNILQRSKDVSFVLDQVLAGALDTPTHVALRHAIDADNIGMLGYSLGGETTLATVTGIHSAGYPAERRIKAAFMAAGTNYGLLLDGADYANASIPLMFFSNDTGIAYQNFNSFTGSKSKYLVDLAGVNHHVLGYQSSWCPDFRNSMLKINPAVFPQAFIDASTLNPSDVVNYVYDSTFYFSYTGARESGIYDFCAPSAFTGITDAQLTAVLFGDNSILAVKSELQPHMPLKPEVAIADTTVLTDFYALSFFDRFLKHRDEWGRGLEGALRDVDPLVDLTANCQPEQQHPFDLQAGDKITFVPLGEGYNVSVTAGAALYDVGTTKLNVSSTTSANLSFAGFSFPVPGQKTPLTTLIVSQDGFITTRTSSDFPAVDDTGSPWYTRGVLLLSNQFTIGALMKSLNVRAAGASGGLYGYYDATNARVVITYLNVPASGTTAPNTLQISIYASGKIEMIIGALAPTGPSFAPGILGTIGVAAGGTRARDLREAQPIQFSRLRGARPSYIRFGTDGAIYEQFVQGIGTACGGHPYGEHD